MFWEKIEALDGPVAGFVVDGANMSDSWDDGLGARDMDGGGANMLRRELVGIDAA